MLSSARQAQFEAIIYQSQPLIGDDNYERAKSERYESRRYENRIQYLENEVQALEKITNKDLAIQYCLARSYAELGSALRLARKKSPNGMEYEHYLQSAMTVIEENNFDKVQTDVIRAELIGIYSNIAIALGGRDTKFAQMARANFQTINEKKGEYIRHLIPLDLYETNTQRGLDVYRYEIKNILVTLEWLSQIEIFNEADHIYIGKLAEKCVTFYLDSKTIKLFTSKNAGFFQFLSDLHCPGYIGRYATYERFTQCMRRISLCEFRGNEDWFVQACYYNLQIIVNALSYHFSNSRQASPLAFLRTNFCVTVKNDDLFDHIKAIAEQLRPISRSLAEHASLTVGIGVGINTQLGYLQSRIDELEKTNGELVQKIGLFARFGNAENENLNNDALDKKITNDFHPK